MGQKSTGAAKWAAALLGIGVGTVLVFGLKLLVFLFVGSAFLGDIFGNVLVRLATTGSGIYVGSMIVRVLLPTISGAAEEWGGPRQRGQWSHG